MAIVLKGYLATVTDLYDSDRYERGQALARARWSNVVWTEPARLGWSLDQWRAVWPDILATLDLLAVIPRADRTIGRGVWQEIIDCQARGLPIYFLDGARWRQLITLEKLPGVSFRYWAEVRG